MKSIKLFPILATGPFLGPRIRDNYKSDRTKLMTEIWKINESIRFIFPDDVAEKRAYNTKFQNISRYLEDKTDQFEYIISKLILHHFNLHLTGASIFELGQFHNFNIHKKTTVLSPSFEHISESDPKKIIKSKYEVSVYVEGIYSITYYDANIDKSGLQYYPSAITTQNDIRTIKTLYWQTYKIVKKLEKMNINMIPRLYSKKLGMQSITFFDDKDFKINIPIKHFLILYFNFALKNWTQFVERFEYTDAKQMLGFHKLFKDYVHNFLIKHPTIKGENKKIKWTVIFSKNRCQFKNILYIFDWFIANQFTYLFDKKNKNQRHNMREMLDNECEMFHYVPKDMYYSFNIKRSNRSNREVTTYNKNYLADLHKAEIKKQSRALHNQLDDRFTYSYAYKTNSGNGLYNAISVHKQNISNKFTFIKIDIKNFFDSIKPEDIKSKLPVDTFWNQECKQGTILAPLFSNIVFQNIDESIKASLPKGSQYTRYSDDILITIPNELSKIDLRELISIINEKITGGNFEINNEKMAIGDQRDCFKYLGFIYKGNNKWSISNKKSKKIASWVKDPKKFGLNKKYIFNVIYSLKINDVNYRNENIINKFYDENNI